MRVLLIEDSPDLAANLLDFLAGHGHQVDWARDGLQGLRLALDGNHDAIILDVGLPWMDGLELCRRLRGQAREQPVLMLTARDELESKIAGFEAGADDYLVKPFAMSELEARLQALHRRNRALPRAGAPLSVAGLSLDPGTLRVMRDGVAIRLPPIELRLLALLLRESHRVVPRSELEFEIWGDIPPDSDALRAHMHILRTAIDKPFPKPLLHTMHGVGYRLCDSAAL